jgi:hypothetical protein
MDGEETTAADSEGGVTWHGSGVRRHLRDRNIVLRAGLLYWAAMARGSPIVVALIVEEQEDADGESGRCGSGLASWRRRRRARPGAATGPIWRRRGVTPSSSPPP